MTVYLSGKYSGDIDANIAAARTIAIELWEKGYAVLCPHLNTQHFEIDCRATYDDYIRGDIELIKGCDAVVMLPGWHESTGAKLEFDAATRIGKPIYCYPDLPPLTETYHKNVLDEAYNVVNGARREEYGTPLENHDRTAAMFSAFLSKKLKEPLTPQDVCMFNILQKVSRGANKITRDTQVDIAGYAYNLELLERADD